MSVVVIVNILSFFSISFLLISDALSIMHGLIHYLYSILNVYRQMILE